jgi:poly(beta-D-mannuronate) lyase
MVSMKRSVALCWLLILIPIGVHAQRLRSPWDAAKTTPIDTPYNCPAAPAFTKSFNVDGYYTDKQYSVIDPAKLAAFNQATEGPTHLGQFVTRAADAWQSTGNRAAAVCVYSLLQAAARADAWDEKMPQLIGVYLQNWMLSGTAIAYLKVRESHVATPDQDAEMQKWFGLVAARVREYFDAQRQQPGSDGWNNHMYWAGLAVAAQGIANNDRNAFLWGLAAYRMGVDAIQPDGSLFAEMNRAGMAEHYQLYALGPLIMLAELAAANGLDMYAEDDGAIHRLVKFSVAGLEDPSIIEKRTGVHQDLPEQIAGLEIGWAVPYIQRFPDAHLSTLLAKAQWTSFWQWGGAPPDASLASPSPAEAGFTVQLQRAVKESFATQFPDPHALIPELQGGWCIQGDATRHASIEKEAGSFGRIKLTKEQGDSASAQLAGDRSIVAPAWDYLTGTLTPRGTQIDWYNGIFWERCTAISLYGRLNLTGTWYPNGFVSISSTIQQHGAELQLDNGQGSKGTGQINKRGQITTSWNGNTILGEVTADGNHINWNNQTYWTRASIYEQPKK